MRWALASEGERRRFEPVGFWVDKDWKFIRKDLEKRLDYCKLEVLFSLTKELLEEVLPPEKELVVELIEEIKIGFDKLIKALDPEKYPKSRIYIENFARNALLVFDYWLEGKGWIPMTTNAIESAFSRIVNRAKHVGRRWSDEGLINWLMIAFRMIYKPELWDELWTKYLEIHKQLRFSRLKVSYTWTQCFASLWDKA